MTRLKEDNKPDLVNFRVFLGVLAGLNANFLNAIKNLLKGIPMRSFVLIGLMISFLPVFAGSLMVEELEISSQQETVSFVEMITQAQQKDVVMVGETHTDLAAHQLQLAVLKALVLKKQWVIGIEWLPYSKQNALDAYLNGEINEVEFLRQSEYPTRWGYDYRYLKPIFDFAKQNQIAIYALNAPREITQKVSQSGLTALSKEERSRFPDPLLSKTADYKNFLTRFFTKHHMNPQRIETSLIVQSIWDQTMAQSIHKVMAKTGQKMLVFAGKVHTRKDQAIANALKTLAPKTQIVSIDGGGFEAEEKTQSDYFVYLDELSLPKGLSLDVGIEQQEAGVSVGYLVKDGRADQLGLKEGDRLLKFGDITIRSLTDFYIAQWTQVDRDEVHLIYERELPLLDIQWATKVTVQVQK